MNELIYYDEMAEMSTEQWDKLLDRIKRKPLKNMWVVKSPEGIRALPKWMEGHYNGV